MILNLIALRVPPPQGALTPNPSSFQNETYFLSVWQLCLGYDCQLCQSIVAASWRQIPCFACSLSGSVDDRVLVVPKVPCTRAPSIRILGTFAHTFGWKNCSLHSVQLVKQEEFIFLHNLQLIFGKQPWSLPPLPAYNYEMNFCIHGGISRRAFCWALKCTRRDMKGNAIFPVLKNSILLLFKKYSYHLSELLPLFQAKGR